MLVSFSVQADWYWSFSRLVLEYLMAGTAYEADLLFEGNQLMVSMYSSQCPRRLHPYRLQPS